MEEYSFYPGWNRNVELLNYEDIDFFIYFNDYKIKNNYLNVEHLLNICKSVGL
jgi:hypothetical protein